MSAATLDLIDLDQPLPGQRRFISCWLVRAPGLAFVVDPGPRSTASRLVARLRELGVARLDWILLTHVHLDHAGGTAELAAAFPQARVVCHENGRGHLAAPGRLWEGSRAVLGQAAEVYGEPAPVPADRLLAPAAAGAALVAAGLRVIHTPGHAPHHLCFLRDGTLFVGEAAGTYAQLPGAAPYLRPATPPRFFLEVAVASLDRLLALEPPPARLAFAHHGLATRGVTGLLSAARAQLGDWVAALRDERRAGEPLDDGLLARMHARLLATDPHYASWRDLDADIRERELGFTRQTLAGMVEYLDRPPA